ncbi:MAG: hypothetical protein IJH64_02125 [Oscillospiraceae bacterium]|nr:hypothetical protein [Oscillospiraceae bacterium]
MRVSFIPSWQMDVERDHIITLAQMISHWYVHKSSPTDSELSDAMHTLFQCQFRVSGYTGMRQMESFLSRPKEFGEIKVAPFEDQED